MALAIWLGVSLLAASPLSFNIHSEWAPCIDLDQTGSSSLVHVSPDGIMKLVEGNLEIAKKRGKVSLQGKAPLPLFFCSFKPRPM